MKILIVDDEKFALSRLQRLLNEKNLFEIETFLNPLNAYERVLQEDFDVAFLDISMPEMNGLELANKILEVNPKTFIIFQTAFEEHALEAYNVGGMGYLLKPVESDSLGKVLEKVNFYIQEQSFSDEKKIIAKRGNKLYLINLEDIYYIKADLDEVIIRIKETDAYVRKKIGELEKLLSQKKFFRIHRSYIVNVDKIKSMQSVEQSKLQISFNGIDEVITSSKDGAKEFREYLEKKIL